MTRMQLDASNAAPARTTVALGEITMFVTLSGVYWYANCITALVLAGKWTVSLAVGSAGVQHAALVTLMILHATTNVTVAFTRGFVPMGHPPPRAGGFTLGFVASQAVRWSEKDYVSSQKFSATPNPLKLASVRSETIFFGPISTFAFSKRTTGALEHSGTYWLCPYGLTCDALY